MKSLSLDEEKVKNLISSGNYEKAADKIFEVLEDQDIWMMMFGMLPRHGHALDPYAGIFSPDNPNIK